MPRVLGRSDSELSRGGEVMRAVVLILLAPVLLPLMVLKTLLGLH